MATLTPEIIFTAAYFVEAIIAELGRDAFNSMTEELRRRAKLDDMDWQNCPSNDYCDDAMELMFAAGCRAAETLLIEPGEEARDIDPIWRAAWVYAQQNLMEKLP